MRLNNNEVRLVIFVAILGFIAVLGSFSTHVRAEAGPIEIGYLMDEDFSFLDYSVPGELKASGWDIEPVNGSLFNGYNAWFKISDTSTSLPVSMNKKIVSQSVGEITLEYRFKFVSVMDGMKWALRSNEDEGVSLITQNDILYLETAGALVPLVTYEAGVEYGVKVVVDVTEKKTSVYVNGVLKASGVAFKQPVTSLNNFQMNTGGTAVGDVYIAAIKIYKGYAVNERFISIMPNSVPVDWVAKAFQGAITVAEMKSSP